MDGSIAFDVLERGDWEDYGLDETATGCLYISEIIFLFFAEWGVLKYY